MPKITKQYRLLHRTGGRATYLTVTAEGSELLMLDPSGSSSVTISGVYVWTVSPVLSAHGLSIRVVIAWRSPLGDLLCRLWSMSDLDRIFNTGGVAALVGNT